jgi:hypothetical protein
MDKAPGVTRCKVWLLRACYRRWKIVPLGVGWWDLDRPPIKRRVPSERLGCDLWRMNKMFRQGVVDDAEPEGSK